MNGLKLSIPAASVVFQAALFVTCCRNFTYLPHLLIDVIIGTVFHGQSDVLYTFIQILEIFLLKRRFELNITANLSSGSQSTQPLILKIIILQLSQSPLQVERLVSFLAHSLCCEFLGACYYCFEDVHQQWVY